MSITNVTEQVRTFLNGKISLHEADQHWKERSFVIQNIIHGLLSEIQTLEEIRSGAVSVEACLTGSYLGNKVVSNLHPIVNDQDFTLYFRIKDGKEKSTIYSKVHEVVRNYLTRQITPAKFSNFSCALKRLGVLKDSFCCIKDIGIGLIELPGNTGSLPLSININILEESSWRHMVNVDSLYVPIRLMGETLGSESPDEFTLYSKEGEDVPQVVNELQKRVITSSRPDQDWDPRFVSHFELGRYLLWIVERWTEPGSRIFSCLYEGSISKTRSLEALWTNLHDIVAKKRLDCASYPLFTLCNLIFHSPPDAVNSLLLELKNYIPRKSHWSFGLLNALYEEGNLKRNALFSFSVQIPLLSKKLECVEHLERKFLQCHFIEPGKELSILVPIPQEALELERWLHAFLNESHSESKNKQVLEAALANLPQDQKGAFLAKCLLEKGLPFLMKYSRILEDEQEKIDFLEFLFCSLTEEDFFQVLNMVPVADEAKFNQKVLARLAPHLIAQSESFQNKCMELLGEFKQDWLSQFVDNNELFLKMLSWVIYRLQPKERGRFICDLLYPLIPNFENWNDLVASFPDVVKASRMWKNLSIDLLLKPRIDLKNVDGLVEKTALKIADLSYVSLNDMQTWIVKWKLAVLHKDFTYIKDYLKLPFSDELALVLKDHFPSPVSFRPILDDLIEKENKSQATYLLQILKAAFGEEMILPGYIQLMREFPGNKTIKQCLDVLKKAWVPERAWKRYKMLASVPAIASWIETQLTEVPLNLSEQEKRIYCKLILDRIAAGSREFVRLASFLSFFNPKEDDVLESLLGVFEKCETQEDQIKVVGVMKRLTPAFNAKLKERIASPYTSALKGKLPISPTFSREKWLEAYNLSGQNPAIA